MKRLLIAAIPLDFGFVAKVELARHASLRLLLRRLGTEFVERLQPDLGVPVLAPCFDPLVAEASAVSLQGVDRAALGGCVFRDPLFALTQNVVVRQRKKVVAALAVPIRDHLRKVVSITPERMRMQVAFPPPQWPLSRLVSKQAGGK